MSSLLTRRSPLFTNSLRALRRYQSVKVDGKLNPKTTPTELATSSTLPNIEKEHVPKRDIDPKRKLEVNKKETAGYIIPKWQEALGEAFIGLFKVDMDKIRSGSIGGSKYYYMCKDQGLQFKNEPLSDTAKFYYETLGLNRSFSQWFQITALHVWLLFVRMRAMPFKYGKLYQQKLVDRLFKDIELRLSEEMNVMSGSIRDNYLKDFNSQLRGIVMSYDEALISDDATLAAALWRNFFNGDKNVDLVHVEAMVRYIRMQLYVLDKTSDREFGFGDFQFVKPNEVVEPLTKENEEQLREKVREKYEPLEGKQLPSNRSILSLEE
ncbi:BA75_05046T0 [Komagataella pastoris]|uniref:BA75_05046T0 n=1 Tax=Komagataella pastoris TaxID=4922 RepID=A0A1B2JIM4_PICPA|nr:BA75_05046T0 [Komagataella pastoris]